jgi:hypothetical protein
MHHSRTDAPSRGLMRLNSRILGTPGTIRDVH